MKYNYHVIKSHVQQIALVLKLPLLPCGRVFRLDQIEKITMQDNIYSQYKITFILDICNDRAHCISQLRQALIYGRLHRYPLFHIVLFH